MAGGELAGEGTGSGAEAAEEDGTARQTFRPLGDYDWPSTPVDRGLKRLVAGLRKRLGGDDEEGLDLGRLVSAERELLDEIVAPPANEPLMAELESTLRDWLERPDDAIPTGESADNVRLIVLPPCDEENFVRSWSGKRGLAVLEPPARRGAPLPDDFPGAACRDAPLIVVPRLEDWFLREETSLGAVRELLDRVDASPVKWLIGCNSWAWQFLAKACGAEALLPEPLTFAAFDGERLRDWLSRLAERGDGRALRFRSAGSGRDAFAPEDDGDEANTMSELAERSLGIPWVAWNLWRASLRTSGEGDEGDRDAGEDRPDGAGDEAAPELGGRDAMTLWVTELEDFTLPDRNDQDALLVLHTLLVHNSLSDEEVFATVPIARHTRVISALVKSGMVRRSGERLSCLPAAYPAIRDGLANAGHPLDVL